MMTTTTLVAKMARVKAVDHQELLGNLTGCLLVPEMEELFPKVRMRFSKFKL